MQPIPQVDPDGESDEDDLLSANVRGSVSSNSQRMHTAIETEQKDGGAERDSSGFVNGLSLEVESQFEVRSNQVSSKALRSWVCVVLVSIVCAVFSVICLITTNILSCSIEVKSSGMMSTFKVPYQLSVLYGYFQVCFSAVNSADQRGDCERPENLNRHAQHWVNTARNIAISAAILQALLLLFCCLLPSRPRHTIRTYLFALSTVYIVSAVLNSVCVGLLVEHAASQFDGQPQQQFVFGNLECPINLSYGGWFQIFIAAFDMMASIALAIWAIRRMDFTGLIGQHQPLS